MNVEGLIKKRRQTMLKIILSGSLKGKNMEMEPSHFMKVEEIITLLGPL